jgi:hypothetical protein
LQPTVMDDQMRPPPGSLLDRITKNEAQKLGPRPGEAADRHSSPRDPRKQTLVLPSNQLHLAKQLPFEADASIFKQELDKLELAKTQRLLEEREERDRLERKRREEARKEEHRITMAKLLKDQIQKEKDDKEKELETDKAVE